MSVAVLPSIAAPGRAAGAADQDDEAQLDGCRPALCSLGSRPHAHCVCGLPMPVRARLCNLCRLEGLTPKQLRLAHSAEEWDGRSYPCRRQRRCGDPHPDGHLHLLIAILAPARGEEADA